MPWGKKAPSPVVPDGNAQHGFSRGCSQCTKKGSFNENHREAEVKQSFIGTRKETGIESQAGNSEHGQIQRHVHHDIRHSAEKTDVRIRNHQRRSLLRGRPPFFLRAIRIRGKRRGLLFPCVFQSLFLPVPPFSFSPADGTCPLQCRKVTDTYPFRAPGMPRPGVSGMRPASSMEMTSTSGRGPFCS